MQKRRNFFSTVRGKCTYSIISGLSFNWKDHEAHACIRDAETKLGRVRSLLFSARRRLIHRHRLISRECETTYRLHMVMRALGKFYHLNPAARIASSVSPGCPPHVSSSDEGACAFIFAARFFLLASARRIYLRRDVRRAMRPVISLEGICVEFGRRL